MMLAKSKPSMTVPEFVAWAAKQPAGRYELVDGEVVPMPSEGGRHNFAKGRIFRLLEDAVQAAGLSCAVFTDGMTVQIEPHRGREPDALVTTGPVADLDALIAVDPMIVAEVISRNSERDDTGTKLLEYFTVPSIKHYLIVRTLERAVVHHYRNPGGDLSNSYRPFRHDPSGPAWYRNSGGPDFRHGPGGVIGNLISRRPDHHRP